MRHILTAAFAALALGAAQAATVDWGSLAGTNRFSDKTSPSSGTITLAEDSTKWVAACVLNISVFQDANGRFPGLFGITNGGTEATRFYYSGGGNTLASIIKHTGSDNNGFTQAEGWQGRQMGAGSYEFVFSFDGATDVLSLYVDGTLYGTVTGFPDWDAVTLVWGQQNGNGYNNLGGTWQADIYLVDGMTYDDAYAAAAIPEPTALALLALGAAGLALRRRAA